MKQQDDSGFIIFPMFVMIFAVVPFLVWVGVGDFFGGGWAEGAVIFYVLGLIILIGICSRD